MKHFQTKFCNGFAEFHRNSAFVSDEYPEDQPKSPQSTYELPRDGDVLRDITDCNTFYFSETFSYEEAQKQLRVSS